MVWARRWVVFSVYQKTVVRCKQRTLPSVGVSGKFTGPCVKWNCCVLNKAGREKGLDRKWTVQVQREQQMIWSVLGLVCSQDMKKAY